MYLATLRQFLLAVLCGVLASGSLVAQATATAQQRDKQAKSSKATGLVVPVFSLNDPIREAPMDEGPFNVSSESLKDLIERLDRARTDDNVPAVILLMGSTPLGSAQLEEVHAALTEIKDAGKPIYAFADQLSFRQLALASAATRISVTPVGELMITGLYGSQPHLRGLLDKLHVTPDFTTCGDYKSAGEMFMRSEPSPEARRMYDWLADGLFENYVSLIANGRDQSQETVRGWIDHGLYSSWKAAELGIIDAVEYRADFLDHIKAEHGQDIKLETKYGKKKKTSVDLSTPFGALQLWAELLQGSKPDSSGKDSIAIVYVEGPIVPGRPTASPFGSDGTAYSDPIRWALDEAAEDDTVKAVVLRVSSPGGSAVASEVILQATRRVAEKKPFVVSMGDVAGSGGYYVACGTDTIFANPSTITASIGVVAGKLVTREMWESIGVNWHAMQRGENSGMFAASEKFSDEQKEILQGWMDEVYGVFKKHVTDARGDRLTKPIDELAGGRVFTGRQALEYGLVDRLGSLEDAIEFVADKADLKPRAYRIQVVPKPKSFVELLMSDMMGTGDDENRIQLSLGSRVDPLWQAATQILGHLEPQRVAAIRRAFIQLDLIQREGVTLAAPEFLFE